MSPPQNQRFVDRHRQAHLNSNSHNQLHILNPLEVGWCPADQHMWVQNIPDCHSNQQQRPQLRAVQNLLHSSEIVQHVHKNVAKLVHTIIQHSFLITNF